MMDSLLDRFCRYVKVETTAVEQTDKYPSSPGQLELGRMLAAELSALGLADASIDEHGIVMATIPATVKGAPTIAWLAHMDTSPEFTAKGVKPVIHRNYDGKDIVLPGDRSRVIRVADSPVLSELVGKTIITTDGTTLLGADDKAGVAVIMTAAAALMKAATEPRSHEALKAATEARSHGATERNVETSKSRNVEIEHAGHGAFQNRDRQGAAPPSSLRRPVASSLPVPIDNRQSTIDNSRATASSPPPLPRGDIGGLLHGPIRIVFTCDEEVGRGVDKLDLKKINALCGYTLDGETFGELDNETFSADLAVVTVTGRNIHPGLATGKMINAIRLSGQFLSRMPWHIMSPERTALREGFLHPYVIEGGVEKTTLRILLRSFDTKELATQAELLRAIAATVLAEHPQAKIDVEVKKQYRNMREHLEKEPRAVALAAEAIRRTGTEPRFQAIRGGTDGSRLSELGLPTPNLAVGMHNFHSPLEFACLEEMESSARVLLELAQLWGKEA